VDLAAEMQQENPIGGGAHAHPGQRADALHDAVGVRLALGVEGDVADHLVATHFDNVDGTEIGPLLRQQRRQTRELAGLIGDFDAHGHAVITVRLVVHRPAPDGIEWGEVPRHRGKSRQQNQSRQRIAGTRTETNPIRCLSLRSRTNGFIIQ